MALWCCLSHPSYCAAAWNCNDAEPRILCRRSLGLKPLTAHAEEPQRSNPSRPSSQVPDTQRGSQSSSVIGYRPSLLTAPLLDRTTWRSVSAAAARPVWNTSTRTLLVRMRGSNHGYRPTSHVATADIPPDMPRTAVAACYCPGRTSPGCGRRIDRRFAIGHRFQDRQTTPNPFRSAAMKRIKAAAPLFSIPLPHCSAQIERHRVRVSFPSGGRRQRHHRESQCPAKVERTDASCRW